jgi:hypothetical protein
MSSGTRETELTDTAYDILKVLGKDADFIYDTIETYIRDAQKANNPRWSKCDKQSNKIEKDTCICSKKH